MYRLKKIIILTFTLLFLLSVTVISKAETYSSNNYTSVGDSVAYGMSASPGKGYVDLFYNYLKSRDENSGMNKYNFGKLGDTSSQLLSKLKDNKDIRDSIKNAKIVTISIGGNNFLITILTAACQAFHVDPNSPTLIKDLGDKINATTDKAAIVQDLISSPGLQNTFIAGVMKFGPDWPQIVSEIKALSPTAQVYAMTIYNPINSSDPLYSLLDPIVQLMNISIEAGAIDGKYKVVDVYSAFKEYKEKEPLVNFDLSSGKVDPHPTNKGHEIIFQAYTAAAKMLETPKPTKAPVSVKSKDTGISSSKYKIDKVKATIAIGNSKITLNTFKSNIKVAKGATYKVLKKDGKTVFDSGNVVPGMLVKVTAEDKKTFKVYRCRV